MAKEVPTSPRKFGVRYGRTTKLRFGKVEDEQRRRHVCPYCTKKTVKRMSVGIWHCNHCDAKFTGKAYTF